MFEVIARFSVKFRWLIIIAWIAAVPILSSALPNINDVTKNDNSLFLPKNSPTQKASETAAQFQTKDTSTRVLLVASKSNGPLTEQDNAAIDKTLVSLKQVKGVTVIQDRGISADGFARQISIGLGGEAIGPQAANVINNLRTQINKNKTANLQLNLTGDFAAAIDADKQNSSSRSKTEIYNVIFIIALLLFVFRAFLAPLVTLIPAVLALIIAEPVIAESTKAGVQVSFLTQILLIVLLLGAGTDYGLFLVFRMREELKNGLNTKDAVIKALSKVGESITFSALTVASALLCLLLASFGLYRGLGPSLAIGLIIMLLISLTFLPALLSVLGRAVFWPSKTIKTPLKIGLWGRVADKVIERPVMMLGLGVVVFAALSLGVFGYKTGGFNNGSAPKGSDSAAGQQVIAKHFPAATTAPQEFFLIFDKPVWQDLNPAYRANQEFAKIPTIKAVSGPFNANGYNISPQELTQLHQSGATNPMLLAAKSFISPDGKTVAYFSVSYLKAGSVAASDNTATLRAQVEKVAKDVGAVDSQIYGQDAAAHDISQISNNDLKRIVPIVLIIIALLLALMLKSLVSPWYLIITVGLSYLATLGFAMIVFVHLGHADGINFVLPFMMFIFSMALGEDYNILVMSRIREESTKLPLKQAVAKAVGITGTTITSAGLILAGTFTVFGLASGDEQMRQIGFSIAFGILLDTFFVRTLLVPSIVTMLGRWNWWPSKLSKQDN